MRSIPTQLACLESGFYKGYCYYQTLLMLMITVKITMVMMLLIMMMIVIRIIIIMVVVVVWELHALFNTFSYFK